MSIEKQKQQESKIPNLIYYDADDIQINKSEETIKLSGNSTFLIGNIYIAADSVLFKKREGLIICENNVSFIYDKEKATASKIIIDTLMHQVRMDNAIVFSDPTAATEKNSEEILGISNAEIAFEKSKENKSKEIETKLKQLREKYVNLKNLESVHQDFDTKEKLSSISKVYAQLLEKSLKIQYQPYVSSLSEKQRLKFIERRNAVEKFNKENPNLVNQISNFTPIPGYIKFKASQIIQKDSKTFLLNNSFVTPCKCSSFEEPAIYGFSSRNAEIDVGDYITLQGATIDVFDIPTFYIPWMKLPIKGKRSSGFLYPNGYVSSNAGQAFSIPFFLVLGDHADSTLTYENFSLRGSRFSAEMRGQLLDDSQIYASGQYISDRTYHNDWVKNNALIDQAIAGTSDPVQKQIFESYRGTDQDQRWYAENSFQLPILEDLFFKGNGQFVSDNNYLSDFALSTSVDPTAAVFGNTSASSRRFLNQELNAEYNGDNAVFSVRMQGLQDLFSVSKSNTPQRVPRIEFSLLPAKYFDLPFVISNDSSFDKIMRFDGAKATSTPNQVFGPYMDGNRLFSKTKFVLPLPTNSYVNSDVSTELIALQYSFPALTSSNTTPALHYLKYSAHVDVPLYGRYEFEKSNSNRSKSITQNITPFVSFDYIPSVNRSSTFPSTYQLWYAQDSIPRSAYLTVGAKTSWKIKSKRYENSNNLIERTSVLSDSPVVDTRYLSNILSKKNVDGVYEKWAVNELDGYYDSVLDEEKNPHSLWPENTYYTLVDDFEMTPLSASISSNYNFIADKTANDLNFLAGPNFNSPYPPTFYGDLLATINWDLNPVLPLTGNIDSNYSVFYHRINSIGGGVSANFPYGFSVSYSQYLKYLLSPIDPSSFVLTTFRTISATYLPKKWLQFGFQWSRSTDPTTPVTTDMSQGRDYGSSYNISFMHLQDCLDLVLSRNKAPGIPENQATYALGLNLKIFGYSANFSQIGDYVNRSLQRQ